MHRCMPPCIYRPLRLLLLLRPPPPHPATPSSWTPFLLSSSIVRNQSSRHRRSPRRRPRRSNARAECQLFLSLSLSPPFSFRLFSFPLCFSRSDPALRLLSSLPPSTSDGRRRPGPNSFPIYDRRKRLGGTRGFEASGTKMVENGSFRQIRRFLREGDIRREMIGFE